MSAKINCFIPFQDKDQVKETVRNLKSSELVSKIYLLAQTGADAEFEGCSVLQVDSLNSTETIKAIAQKADAEYIGRKARIAAFEIASTAWSGRGVQTSANVAEVATSWTGRGASAYYRDARHGQYLGD